MSYCLTRPLGIYATQVAAHLCPAILLASVAVPSATAQSLGGKAPVPQSQGALAEWVDLPAGSACSAFGLKNDSGAALICFRTSQASISGKWEEAHQLAVELTKRYPTSGIGNFWLGQVEFKKGNNISAVRQFEAAVDLNPEIELLHMDLGLCYLAIHQYKLFEQEMEWALAHNPQIALPNYYLGQYYLYNLDQPEKAAEYFQQALRLNSGDFKSRYHLGYILEAKNELDRGAAEYQLAMATVALQKAIFSWPLQGLARIYLLKEKFDEALRYAREAVSMEPKLAGNRLALGKLYIQLGEASKGIEELKIAVKLDPTDATPHYLLSRAYIKLKMSAKGEQEQKLFLEIKAAY